MYHHVKKLMSTGRVDEPDPRFGNMLLEQFGGANGELAAARKQHAAADLALIGAAQRVEHHEFAGYITARNLA